MKKLIIFLLSIQFIGCFNQTKIKEENKKLIQNFVEEVIKDDKRDYTEIEKYSNLIIKIKEKEDKTNGKKQLDSIIQNSIRLG